LQKYFFRSTFFSSMQWQTQMKCWKFVNQLELSELKLKYIFWLITIISLYEIQLHAWLRLLSVNWNLKLDLQTFFRMIQMQFTFVLHRLTISWSRTKLFFKFILRKKKHLRKMNWDRGQK
jgi:hypothetical protein